MPNNQHNMMYTCTIYDPFRVFPTKQKYAYLNLFYFFLLELPIYNKLFMFLPIFHLLFTKLSLQPTTSSTSKINVTMHNISILFQKYSSQIFTGIPNKYIYIIWVDLLGSKEK